MNPAKLKNFLWTISNWWEFLDVCGSQRTAPYSKIVRIYYGYLNNSKSLISFMKNWKNKRFIRDGCRDCFAITENAIEKTFKWSVWQCSIRKISFVDSCLRINDYTLETNKQSKIWTEDNLKIIVFAGKVYIILYCIICIYS